VERRSTLVKRATILKNQLHGQLSYNYPSYHKFFSEIDGKTALEFWEKYPSPSALKDVTLEELSTFLYEQSRCFLTVDKAQEIMLMVDSDGDTEIKEYQYIRDFLIESIVSEIKYISKEVGKVDLVAEKTIERAGFFRTLQILMNNLLSIT
jgi:hypothetical protein